MKFRVNSNILNSILLTQLTTLAVASEEELVHSGSQSITTSTGRNRNKSKDRAEAAYRFASKTPWSFFGSQLSFEEDMDIPVSFTANAHKANRRAKKKDSDKTIGLATKSPKEGKATTKTPKSSSVNDVSASSVSSASSESKQSKAKFQKATQAPEPPTSAPTDAPTVSPSSSPTEIPTISPTDAPTELPSSSPTAVPTGSPTDAPTARPTGSTAPTGSRAPSSNPTLAPTETFPRTAFLSAISCGVDVNCMTLLTTITGREDLQDIFASMPSTADAVTLFDAVAADAGRLQQFQDAADESAIVLTGTSAEIIAQCQADASLTCCPSGATNPCQWSGTASIGSNSCTVSTACNLQERSIVFQNSCTAVDSCDGVNYNSSGTNPVFTSIGPNACGSLQSCYYTGSTSNGSVLISEGSCNGDEACSYLGAGNGYYAMSVPASTKRVSDITIGRNSCVANDSCTALNSYFGVETSPGVYMRYDQLSGDVTIGDGTCVAANSCDEFAYSANFDSNVVLGNAVCTAASECAQCGARTATPVGFCLPGETFTIADSGTCPSTATDFCA